MDVAKVGRPRRGTQKIKTTSFSLSPELIDRVEQEAEANGISRSSMVEEILRKHFSSK